MSLFICSNCNYGSGSWIGKCPDCGAWNSLEKQPDEKNQARSKEKTIKLKLTPLSKADINQNKRIPTGLFELDRVLGGGLISGEVVLLSGEPGVGKSTMLLQALTKLRVVYISGEESASQIKDRGERLKLNLSQFLFSDDIQIEGIVSGLEEAYEQIDLVVVDSIQTVYSKTSDSAPGSVSQLKECASRLIAFAKKFHIPVIVIGHITKDGDIAGPKTLEHLVDCVLSFEGERVSNYRILRANKNRFGPTDEIGIFEMKDSGLKEVNNPTIFLNTKKQSVVGMAIAGVAEGKRPLFYEIQTLAVPTQLAIPRRVVKGIDYNKLLLLLAVIRKQLRLQIEQLDIFVNVAGGVSIKSPAADLAIIASIISGIKNIPVSNQTVFIGEIGLLGEIRPIYLENKILMEAKRLQFKKIISSQTVTNVQNLLKFIT